MHLLLKEHKMETDLNSLTQFLAIEDNYATQSFSGFTKLKFSRNLLGLLSPMLL